MKYLSLWQSAGYVLISILRLSLHRWSCNLYVFRPHLNQSAFEVISERILSEVDGGVLEQTFHTKVVALEYSGFGLFFMPTVFPSIRTMIHFRSVPITKISYDFPKYTKKSLLSSSYLCKTGNPLLRRMSLFAFRQDQASAYLGFAQVACAVEILCNFVFLFQRQLVNGVSSKSRTG